MSEELTFYQKQASYRRSSLPWVAALQSRALSDFARLGLPTRYDEEWKYTSVESLRKQSFSVQPLEVLSTKVSDMDLPIQKQLYICNGELLNHEAFDKERALGVLVLPLADALNRHPELVQPHLTKILPQEHAFQALNTAMLQQGVFIYVPQGVVLEEPLAIIHVQNQNQHAVYLRHLVIAEADSSIAIVEDYTGMDATSSLTNTATEIFLGQRAQVIHYKIQRESKQTIHLGHTAVRQMAYSQFASHVFNLGGALVRSDVSIDLQEAHAFCLMNGVYIPAEGQHVDQHTRVRHLVPHCASDQNYKGVLLGRSQAVFNGKVIVVHEAQHSDAKQQNKNLLLSPQAEINTKPQLEIFADDVSCSHGATVGQLDEDAVFYLASRGIERLDAMHYLIYAFVEENLALIPCHRLADWLRQQVTQQLG